jgi:hypothetical protein
MAELRFRFTAAIWIRPPYQQFDSATIKTIR